MASSRAAATGTARERDVRRELEREGWFVVRAAGSHGVCDLVAIRRKPHAQDAITALLVEVKTNRDPFHDFGPARRERLSVAALRCGAVPMLAHWPTGGTLTMIPASEWPQQHIGPTLNQRRAQQLREAGWTLQAIGDELGVSRQRAHQLVNGGRR